MTEQIHILLVDDEADYVEPMAFWLRSKGYHLSVARSGESAIKIVKETNPHLIFLDIKMPGMDGIETLKRIREFNQKVPVIMLTAYADKERFYQAQELKISGFFAKDGEFNELRHIIEFTIKTHKKLLESS